MLVAGFRAGAIFRAELDIAFSKALAAFEERRTDRTAGIIPGTPRRAVYLLGALLQSHQLSAGQTGSVKESVAHRLSMSHFYTRAYRTCFVEILVIVILFFALGP
jgi:hypothetical protein